MNSEGVREVAASNQPGQESGSFRQPAGELRADRARVLVIGAAAVSRFREEILGEGFDVVTAPDEKMGLERAAARALDLIVVDATSSPSSGDRMIAGIRGRRELDGIPVLILSDEAGDAVDAGLLREGAQDRVVKPVSAEDVRARALNLVEMKRARDILQAAVASPGQDLAELARRVAAEKHRAEEAQRKAETASRAKDEFLAVLAHELRTPLNAVLGWTAILRREGVSASETRRGLDVIDRNARAQARLIEDVLEISAMVRGKMSVSLDPVALKPVLSEALDALRPAAEAKQIDIHWHGDEGDLTVRGDAERLVQVVHNLVGNAIKFTPAGGRVTVRVSVAEGAAVLDVEDTGIGIAPDFLPHIFDPFTQGVSRTTAPPGGLGLGLAIVRHLVELHGGTIHAASPGDGQGATFTVRLPAVRSSTGRPTGASCGV